MAGIDQFSEGERLGEELAEKGLTNTQLNKMLRVLKEGVDRGKGVKPLEAFLAHQVSRSVISPEVYRAIKSSIEQCKSEGISFMDTLTRTVQWFSYFQIKPFIDNWGEIEKIASRVCDGERNVKRMIGGTVEGYRDIPRLNLMVEKSDGINLWELSRKITNELEKEIEDLKKTDFKVWIEFK